MKITPEDLKKYSSGACTPEERRKVELWLTQHDDEHLALDHEDKAIDSIWAGLEQRVGKNRPVTFWKTAIRIAACLLLVGSAAWFFYPSINSSKKQIAQVECKTIHVKHGQRGQVQLADGTRVYLNAGSTFTYPESFSDTVREVTLQGEAFFEVANNATKPFIVKTDSSFTQVLGTSFNLQAYDGDSQVVITVEEGKVMFGRGHEKSVMLTKGMQGVLPLKEPVYARSLEDLGSEGWRQNRLIIQNEPLHEVAKRLERWYGVRVSIKNDKLANLTLTGTFKAVPLEKVMRSFAFSVGIKYAIKDTLITIY